MSKELVFVLGAPFSGRTTWINKNLLFQDNSNVCVDANNYNSLYTNSKLSEESIEASRLWCLEEVNKLMVADNSPNQIILCLIGCRPDRWREFIQLAINNSYEINFRVPPNKLLYYNTRHNTTMEQFKFLESKCLSRYPRDKKEVKKRGTQNSDGGVVYKDTNESTMFRYVVTEFESSLAFYQENRKVLGADNQKWLDKINSHYKVTITNEIKRLQKKAEKEVQENEKAQKKAEKEARKSAWEAQEAQEAQEAENLKNKLDTVEVKDEDEVEVKDIVENVNAVETIQEENLDSENKSKIVIEQDIETVQVQLVNNETM